MPELCIIFKYKERNKIRKLANLFQKKRPYAVFILIEFLSYSTMGLNAVD
jgi:hypothetical protein